MCISSKAVRPLLLTWNLWRRSAARRTIHGNNATCGVTRTPSHRRAPRQHVPTRPFVAFTADSAAPFEA
eukprot:11045901-Lingulodinium_polyedra.AAC.1